MVVEFPPIQNKTEAFRSLRRRTRLLALWCYLRGYAGFSLLAFIAILPYELASVLIFGVEYFTIITAFSCLFGTMTLSCVHTWAFKNEIRWYKPENTRFDFDDVYLRYIWKVSESIANTHLLSVIPCVLKDKMGTLCAIDMCNKRITTIELDTEFAEHFSLNAIAGVVAHEYGHYLAARATQAQVCADGLLCPFNVFAECLEKQSKSTRHSPAVAKIVHFFAKFCAWLGSRELSRKSERLADDYGVCLLGTPEPLMQFFGEVALIPKTMHSRNAPTFLRIHPPEIERIKNVYRTYRQFAR
jgi:hypothetical protein